MAFTLDLVIHKSFSVRSPPDDVWSVLADVPTSASYFPGVDRLVPLGGGVFRWELAAAGPPQARVQTVYVSRYVGDRAAGTVKWTPVVGEGNARVAGGWSLTPLASGTRVTLHNEFSLDLAFPSLLRRVLAPVVEAAFQSYISTYIEGLTRRFGGAL